MPGIELPLPSGTNLTALVLKLETEIKTTVQASMGPEINVLTISILSIGGKAIQRRLMKNLLEMRGLLQGTVQVEFKGEYGIPCNINDGDCETNFSKKVVANTSSSPTTSPTVRCVFLSLLIFPFFHPFTTELTSSYLCQHRPLPQ